MSNQKSIGWLARIALFLGVGYLTWIVYDSRPIDDSGLFGNLHLVAPIETMIFVVLVLGLPMAIVTATDRYVLGRFPGRPVVFMSGLSSLIPPLILVGGDRGEFVTQMVAQAIYAIAVIFLNLRQRRRGTSMPAAPPLQ